MKKLIFFILFLGLNSQILATHLVGGSISYQNLGDPDGNGQVNYRIVLVAFQNCNSPFWGTGFPENPIQVGVYPGQLTGTSVQLVRNVNLFFTDSFKVPLNVDPNCAISVDTCVNRTIYVGTVELPVNATGYSIYYDRCCRTPNVVNLSISGDQGDAYYAWIPPGIVTNNSPVFNDLTTPFVCLGDTFTFFNSVTDPDGDLVQFSLVDPWFGYDTDLAPNNPPDNPMQLPIPPVNWAPGFNATQPFGPLGYAYLNANTGFSQFMATQLGPYVITVEVREFRNGNLVGISRRNIQFTVLNCPANSPPQNQAPVNNGIVNVTIEAGDSTCIPITYVDLEGDSIFFFAQGDVLNPLVTNPPGIINTPNPQPGTLITQFCWNTTCAQGRAVPYTFTASVFDDACIPEPGGETYSITVQPFTGPQQITGALAPCANQQSVLYQTDSLFGAVYNWTITGGTIAGSPKPHQILVNWGSTSLATASVQVSATSRFGCSSAPINIPISIQNFQANLGSDLLRCEGDSLTLGGVPTLPAGFNYNWQTTQSGTFSTLPNPKIRLDTTTTFVLLANNADGCLVRDSITIPVYLNDTVSAGNDTVLCSNSSLQLQAAGGVSYNWSPASVFNSSTSANPIATLNQASALILEATTSSGCIFLDTVSVALDSFPSVDAGVDTSICNQDSLIIGRTVNADSSILYQWISGTGIQDPSNAITKALPIASGLYILQASTVLGCTSNDTLNVTLLNLPVVLASNDTNICAGDTLALSASGALSYRWRGQAWLSDSSIANPLTAPIHTTVFTLVGTDANGCQAIDSTTVNVFDRALNLGEDAFLCPGDSIQIATQQGQNFNWTPSTGVSNPNIGNPRISVLNTTTYVLSAVSQNGCNEQDTIMLIVDNRIPTNAGVDTALCFGDSLVLGGNPSAPANVRFNWSLLSSPLDTLSNPVVEIVANNTYILTTTSDTCAGIDTIVVEVLALPVVNHSNDTAVCQGDSVLVGLNSQGIASIVWNEGGQDFGFNADSVFVTVGASKRIQFIITDTNGCVNQDSILFQMLSLPNVNAGNDTAICSNDTLALTLTGALNYQFIGNQPLLANADSALIQVSASTLYIIQGTDGQGCRGIDSLNVDLLLNSAVSAGADTLICFGNLLQLNAIGGVSYQWLNNQSLLSADNIRNPILNADSSRTYYVSITDTNGCVNQDSILVQVNFVGDLVASPDTQVCAGSIVQLSAAHVISPRWLPTANLNNPNIDSPLATVNQSTTYLLTGLDTLGCRDTASIQVQAWALPAVDAGSDKSACSGNSVVLGGNPTTLNGVTVQWQPAALLAQPNSFNPVFTPTQRQQFTVIATDTNGCINSDSLVVGTFDFQVSLTDSSICRGNAAEVRFNYSFSLGNPNISITPNTGVRSVDSAGVILSPNTSTFYTISASSGGCIIDKNVSLDILPQPTAAFSQEVLPACEGVEIQFFNSSEFANRYEWLFSNGSQTNIEDPIEIFNYNSITNARLIAINESGCRDTANFSVGLQNLANLLLIDFPNVFTPNGDGRNDVFEIPFENKFSPCLSLWIYNRWGNLIYATENGLISWDGKNFAGNEAPAGSYFFVIRVAELQYRGHLELIR